MEIRAAKLRRANAPGSIPFQPPTFEDDTYKPKLWIPLREAKEAYVDSSNAGKHATLRLILSPSSTLRAIYAKVIRNYSRAFYSVPFWTYVANSLILVVLTTIGTLFSSTFVAYAFARLHWPGRSVAFVLLLSTMMLPGQVTMIPSFMIWRALGWYNTLNPLWVPAWLGGAFFIFLMVQHMKTIPRELEEAARIDGLNAVQTWWYIIVPLVKPAAAAIAIMTFMGAWNEFMGPLIYLRDQSRFPAEPRACSPSRRPSRRHRLDHAHGRQRADDPAGDPDVPALPEILREGDGDERDEGITRIRKYVIT